MSTVSEWIKSCASFDVNSFDMNPGNQSSDIFQHDPRNPAHQLQNSQQQFLPYNYNSLIALQQDLSNTILTGMPLVDPTSSSSSSLSSSPTPTPSEVTMNDFNMTLNNNQGHFPIITTDQTESHSAYYDSSVSWPRLSMIALGDGIDTMNYPSLLNLSIAPQEMSTPSQNGHGMMTDRSLSEDIRDPLNKHQSQQQSSPATLYPPTPVLASQAPFVSAVDEMVANPMSAQDQFNVILYSWSQQLVNGGVTPTNPAASPSGFSDTIHSPSLSASSPALSTSSYFSSSSAYTASPSSSPSMYSPSLLPSSFPKTLMSGVSGSMFSNNSNGNSTSSYNFTPRSSSKLTRRISETSGFSSMTCSSTLTNNSSNKSQKLKTRSSGPARSLTCQTCKKQYANSSTLRRHIKIHEYEGSAKCSGSSYRGASTDVNQRSLCSSVSFLSLNDGQQPSSGPGSEYIMPSLSPSSSSPSSSSSLLVNSGYNAAKDPYLKKPECVGCNKAFARRDTVILHIKNQKRKWDLLNAILPTLTGIQVTQSADDLDGSMASSPFAAGSPSSSCSSSASSSSVTNGSLTKFKRSQRHRRSHPYRMVEKLWQSTLQRKGYAFTTNRGSSKNDIYKSLRGGIKTENNDEDEEEEEDEEDEEEGEEGLGQGNKQMKDELAEEDNDWPDAEAISKMDSQTKVKWMMESMVIPPCWRERKVRIFGAFGASEQEVLHDAKGF
ncbi:hypothetical protein BGZ76_009258 [Entomortierella beljakovae]|nr:hypothetical protein BGZ76_009258 [Entomortierella beljakovae]